MLLAKTRMTGPGLLLPLILLNACGESTLIHNIQEKEANGILVLLSTRDIPASKGMRDTGREVFYSVSVPASRETEALELLMENDYPRRIPLGRSEVFTGEGMIPTRGEEKAKALSAMEGEIERQLGLVPGVLDVEVNVVVPEESPLKTADEVSSPAKASVAIRYLPAAGGAKPLNTPNVQAIVAASVEKLNPDMVVVMMTPVQTNRPPIEDIGQCEGGGGGFPCNMSTKGRKAVLAAVAIAVIFLGIVAAFMYVRLRSVRGRLIRLQNEIARARRKPAGEISPG